MSRALSTEDIWATYAAGIVAIVSEAKDHGVRADGLFGESRRLLDVARVGVDGAVAFRWRGPAESTGTIVFGPDLDHPRLLAA
jgi:hypothetical protein